VVERAFTLAPFPGEAAPGVIALTGAISREVIRFVLHGDLDAVALPQPAPEPQRADGLWRRTCFEFFVGLAGDPAYREFNLSPSGDWATYRFAGYRAEMTPDTTAQVGPVVCRRGHDTFELHAPWRIPGAGPLEVGVAAVVEDRAGVCRHWALAHPAERPDFHDRRSFRLALPV
jgi:hypothetical protein